MHSGALTSDWLVAPSRSSKKAADLKIWVLLLARGVSQECFSALGLKPTFREPEAFEGNLPVLMSVDYQDAARRAIGRNVDVPRGVGIFIGLQL